MGSRKPVPFGSNWSSIPAACHSPRTKHATRLGSRFGPCARHFLYGIKAKCTDPRQTAWVDGCPSNLTADTEISPHGQNTNRSKRTSATGIATQGAQVKGLQRKKRVSIAWSEPAAWIATALTDGLRPSLQKWPTRVFEHSLSRPRPLQLHSFGATHTVATPLPNTSSSLLISL